ncbi:ARID DNA-binding domain-containing protein [Tanacetum coccineum]
MEEIEAYNHSISNNKFKEYTCFYCNQIGHVAKNCSTKAEDNKEGSAYVNTIIRAKIIQNKSLVVCFKCKRIGHFANLCPTKGNQTPIEETVEPIVSVKYPEFIHFKTRGIIKGTNLGTWDDYRYVSNTTDKHLTSNTKFFANLKEEFIVEKLESQKKLLFTYGIGEVLLTSGNTEYLIPGVYYAPEVSLNILSQNLLRQQGFEILYEEGGYILEYMFRNLQGKNIDENKMRQRHNNFLDDYFESLDESTKEKGKGVIDPNTPQTFTELVDFMDLIKNDKETSNEWDTFRDRFDKALKWFYNHYLKKELPGKIPPIIQGVTIHLFDLYKLMDCMGGFLSVQFGQEFGALAEILGLTRSNGEEIKECYITYLEVLVSYYKTARAPRTPMTGEEGMDSLEEYHWNHGEEGATFAVEKEKRLEHFGIKLEEEEEGKQQQTADQEEGALIKCYKCKSLGHYAFECPKKNKGKEMTYKEALATQPQEDTPSTSSDDFTVII